LVKQLTGGDTIACRRMHEDYWQYTPTHKIMLACNHRPRIKGTDWAIWRRIKLVPFAVIIGPDEQDKELGEKLKAEAAGILAWAVRGCLAWQKDGLGQAEEIEQATEQYRSSEDVLAGFLNEVCDLDLNATVRASELLKAYREFSSDKQITHRQFGELLTEKGFQRFKSNTTRYRGISLLPEP
jgi:putative DNA primase/helicase